MADQATVQPNGTATAVQQFQNNHGGNVSVVVADTEHNKEDNDASKMLTFTAGPKFQDALMAQLNDYNKLLESQGNVKLSMAAFLRQTVAAAINFDLAADPVKTRSKYANDAERKAAIKATQQKTAAERKKINKLINLAKQKQGKKDAIAALMASLGITDDELDDE